MNYQKLKKLIDGKKVTKAKVIRETGISRPALDAILDGNDFKVTNLEKIAECLSVNVGYFFDEESIEHYEQHGDRALMAKTIQHLELDQRNIGEESKTELKEVAEEIVLPSDCPDEARHALTLLKSQVASLRELIAEKDARIAEKNETIAELRERIKELKDHDRR